MPSIEQKPPSLLTNPPATGLRTRLRATCAVLAAALLAVATPALADRDEGYAGSDGYDGYSDAPAGYDAGYSYVRNLRGTATLLEAGGETERTEVVLNQPVLAGDRLWVAPGSLVEVLLSDGNLLRIDGDSEVAFDRLALSPESGDRTTELRLAEGNVQLVVFADALGDGAPRIALPSATVYLEDAGSYRVTADRDWAQVVAREGWAEVATARGSTVVRAGEEAIVEGAHAPRAYVRRAGAHDDLERWGARLDDEQLGGDALARYEVDDSLRYAAAPLERHGTWVTVEQRRAWRPYVDHGWRPYRDGRWRHTPIGLTWVSYEPWGWVPYHYGTWDLHPHHGWVWYPGARFAPAWVYWYWGPSHVAWVPAGYYTHYYSPWYRRGFRSGVYGWAGGHYGIFADWVFCPTVYLGSRHQDRHAWAGRDWRGRDRRDVIPRGIITTDTRGLRPENWRDHEQVERVLRTRPRAGGPPAGGPRAGGPSDGGPAGDRRLVAGRGGELPDVTPFVERRRELPADVERRVTVDEGQGGRVAGTPLAPGTVTASRARPSARTPDRPSPVAGDRAVARPSAGAPALGGGRAEAGDGAAGRRPIAVRGDRRGGGERAGGAQPGTASRPRAADPRGAERPAPEAAPDRAGRVVGARPETGVRPETPPERAPVVRSSPRSADPPTAERVAPRPVTPSRSMPPATSPRTSGARDDRGLAGARAGGSPSTPEAYRSSPRFRGGSGDAAAASPRSTPPRGTVTGARTAPARPTPQSERPPAAAPRSDRGSISAAPPARRVVRGIRGDSAAPRRATPPARTAPSSPRSAPPRASAPSSPPPRRSVSGSPSSGSGGSRATVRGRSSGGSGGSRASAGSGGGNGGGGRAARVRGEKGDGDNE